MWRPISKVLTVLVGVIAFALQAFVLALVLYDLVLSGAVNFASALGYGAGLYFTVPCFLLWLVLTRFVDVGFRTQSANRLYLGSHVLIVLLMIFFPGKFGP
ncbi:hypothetical protein [uncultured Herbaspirillum sp.]|uniref:hypothetical protein n=1 Tax=uncultured Herbaspirillum sp. TaxID=160236 RepID=UPI00258C996F|nr:hypothetical protein [uncultured Herbaspirillum sp.]